MDTLKDFYKFYRPLQRKYDLQMIYKTNSKEAKITIRWRGKELVKVAEETTEACFSRTKRELEERMKKYEDLEERGRLIKLPCKVGDTIYAVGVLGCETVEQYKVIKVDYHSNLATDRSEFYIVAFSTSNPKADIGFYDKEFGKNVFLTKSEAEAKLKELRGAK